MSERGEQTIVVSSRQRLIVLQYTEGSAHMGAWGAGSFENDTAMDFLDEFADAPDGLGDDDEPGKVTMILEMLATVDAASTDMDDMPEGDEDEDDEEAPYLESDLACGTIVMAEVLAAIYGKPHPEFASSDEELASAVVGRWARTKGVKEKRLADQATRELAIRAISKIRDAGELHDLWSDAEPADKKAWQAAMSDLLARLK